MTPQEARKSLRTVDEGVQFYFCNGRRARNLRELMEGIESLDAGGYRHHVYFDHNDFSNWLLDIIGEPRLARDIFGATKDNAHALVGARFRYLANLAERDA